jgi:hypothetical protein
MKMKIENGNDDETLLKAEKKNQSKFHENQTLKKWKKPHT